MEQGEVGELCLRGIPVMLGYWNLPEASAETLRNGWHHTGDLFMCMENGQVRMVDRNKYLIKTGGENVYPREVEEFLYTHPAISDVQVIGVPDLKYGEELMAWIKLKQGASVTPDEIKEFCKGRIAHFKVPKYIKFVGDFPMTVTGKIQKYKMREESIKELGLEEVAKMKTA